RVGAALAGQSAHVLVDDLDAGLAVLDEWAPEHLEVVTAGAAGVAARVRNAGAVFVGPYAPVSLGDYLAGSNHVLPTGGTARHTAGLSLRHRTARPRRGTRRWLAGAGRTGGSHGGHGMAGRPGGGGHRRRDRHRCGRGAAVRGGGGPRGPGGPAARAIAGRRGGAGGAGAGHP